MTTREVLSESFDEDGNVIGSTVVYRMTEEEHRAAIHRCCEALLGREPLRLRLTPGQRAHILAVVHQRPRRWWRR